MKKKFYFNAPHDSLAQIDWSETFEKMDDAINDAKMNVNEDSDYIVFECHPVRRVSAGKATVKAIK